MLKECNTESFFQRSLPLGTGFGLAAYFATKNGYLRPSLKYGSTPKVVVGVILGYFVGKFSYQSKCARKLMALPDSKLAELLRAKKKGGLYDSLTPDQGFGAGLAMAPFSSQSKTEQYTDETNKNKVSSLDLDTDRPVQFDLDESRRGNVDSMMRLEEELPITASQNAVTYEELRKKNREEYQKRMSGGYSTPSSPNESVEQAPYVIRAPTPRTEPSQQQQQGGKKNKYGDEWTG